jgi:phage replication O-like protein O
MTNGLAKGYTKIANYILESIMSGGFNKRELLILLYVFRHGYGFNREQSDCERNVRRITEEIQVDTSHINKTLKVLVAKKVIKLENDRILFNRHAEQWSKAKTASHKSRPKQPQNQAKTASESGQNGLPNSPKQLTVSDLQAPKETLNKKETPISPKNGDSHPSNLAETTDQIIAFLNGSTGKTFRPAIKGTQKLIKVRLSEGFTVEDFKKVITIKTGQWKGSSNFERYLRPQTLFAKNFEAYLQEAERMNATTPAYGLNDSNTGLRGFGL